MSGPRASSTDDFHRPDPDKGSGMRTMARASTTRVEPDRGPLALVCGGGNLPFVIADRVIRDGRPVVLFPIKGFADAGAVARCPHQWIALGQLGRFFHLLRSSACRDVVMIGYVTRPPLRALRFDLGTVRLLPRLISMFRGGDDHLLSGVARLLEERGFRLLGAHEVAPEILAPEGTMGRFEARSRDQADIAYGLAVLAAMGPFDVGQAVVVADGHVLAFEAVEGTDQMLARVAQLRQQNRLASPPGAGVLVKAPKVSQDRRIDLPSIGPSTVEGVVAAGLAGLAVTARSVLVAEPEALIATADRGRVFVIGVRGHD